MVGISKSLQTNSMASFVRHEIEKGTALTGSESGASSLERQSSQEHKQFLSNKSQMYLEAIREIELRQKVQH